MNAKAGVHGQIVDSCLQPKIPSDLQGIGHEHDHRYAALKAADQKWDEGDFDVTELALYLADLLKAQLSEH